MKIAIGNDHAGVELKNLLVSYLKEEGIEVINHGCNNEESVDYPDFAHLVSEDVVTKKADLGVLICGSGNGMIMTANKHAEIRAALCWTEEIAKMAKLHNNANILTLPARFISEEKGLEILKTYLGTEFEGGRHQRRIDKMNTTC